MKLRKFYKAVETAGTYKFSENMGVMSRLRIPIPQTHEASMCSGATKEMGFTLDVDRSRHLGILDVLMRVDVALSPDCAGLKSNSADAPEVALVLTVAKEHSFEIPASYGQAPGNIVSFILSGPTFTNMDGFPMFGTLAEIHLTITSNVQPVNVYLLGYIFNPDTTRSLVAKDMSLLHVYTKEFEIAPNNDAIDITQCLQDDIPHGSISLKLNFDDCSALDNYKLESIIVWVSGWDANVLLAGHDCVLEGSEWVLCEKMLPTTLLKKAAQIKLQFIFNGPIAPISSVSVKIKCLRIAYFRYGGMAIETLDFL